MNADQRQTLTYLVDDAKRDADQARQAVERDARRLAARLTQVADYAVAGGSINDLGELQGRAADFDIKCAMLNERERALVNAEYLVDRLNAQDDATMSNGVPS